MSNPGPNSSSPHLTANQKPKPLTEEEKKQAAQAEIKKKAQAAQAKINERIQMRNSVLEEYLPFLSGEGGAQGGALGKASHFATMQAEGIAGELIADLIIFFFQLVFNTPFLIHKAQFNAVFEKQMNEMYKGNNIQLVYLPDEKGEWPDIYVMDEHDKIDFTQTYPPGEAPERAVRLQGFVPKPTVAEGYLNALNLHMERMWGGHVLSNAQKLKLRNMVEVGEHEAKKQDKLRDFMMMQKPPSKPTLKQSNVT